MQFVHSYIEVIGKQLNENTDRQLVGEFLATRDERAFREIYRRHTPKLYLLALRMVGWSVDDAQDVVQNTWIRACRKLPDFEWRSSLRTWLTGIVINCARELGRAHHRYDGEFLPETMAAPPPRRFAHELDLEQIIRDLPAGCRHVLVLHEIEGYTHEEIARLLNISIGGSKSQLFHARRTVRAKLEPERAKE